MIRTSSRIGFGFIALVAAATVSSQGERGGRTLELATSVEVLAREPGAGEDGPAQPPRRTLAEAVAGDQVIYTVSFINVGGQPVHDARISTAIPPELSYVAGSAQGPGASVLYSVNDGLSYAPPAELAVTDSAGRERVAGPELYTNIRWVLAGPFDPGVRGFVRFRAIVRGSMQPGGPEAESR